ncbi:Acetyl-CoA:oxalate CoA-transferase [compost metagenome]
MRAANPRLITCDITGYGETGPYAGMRAYDLLVQAESGVASVTGTPEAPGRVGISACDIGTGMYAHAAILEALLQRERTGQGSALHVSLFDAMADWMTVPLLHYDYAGTVWPRVGLGHPTIAPYGAFACGDGQQLLIGVQNDGEWRRFTNDVLLKPEWADDARYRSNQDRVRNATELKAEIESVLGGMDLGELRRRLTQAKIAYASVNGVKELSAHPHLRRAQVRTAHGEASIVAPPVQVRGEPRHLGEVPAIGAHTEAVRAEFGGGA